MPRGDCDGDSCGGTYSSDRYAGDCDADGCDFNSYRQGDTTFYGPGQTIDTTKKFTDVTQFLTDGGSLSEIRRFYVQDGAVVENSQSTIPGVDATRSRKRTATPKRPRLAITQASRIRVAWQPWATQCRTTWSSS